MFTGIILGCGRVAAIEEKGGDLELAIEATVLGAGRLKEGDSISVQGVCLTATRFAGTAFYADVSRETLSKTTLGGLKRGSRVNLEPSLRAGDALGGHIVSGHVDAVGRLTEQHQDGRSWRMEFEMPTALMRFIAPKGSVCVDGVSLTVNQVRGCRFDVNIIPHTREVTTLGDLIVEAGVNVEIDVIARYIERLLPSSAGFHRE
jgi:riboflavin synthase